MNTLALAPLVQTRPFPLRMPTGGETTNRSCDPGAEATEARVLSAGGGPFASPLCCCWLVGVDDDPAGPGPDKGRGEGPLSSVAEGAVVSDAKVRTWFVEGGRRIRSMGDARYNKGATAEAVIAVEGAGWSRGRRREVCKQRNLWRIRNPVKQEQGILDVKDSSDEEREDVGWRCSYGKAWC